MDISIWYYLSNKFHLFLPPDFLYQPSHHARLTITAAIPNSNIQLVTIILVELLPILIPFPIVETPVMPVLVPIVEMFVIAGLLALKYT